MAFLLALQTSDLPGFIRLHPCTGQHFCAGFLHRWLVDDCYRIYPGLETIDPSQLANFVVFLEPSCKIKLDRKAWDPPILLYDSYPATCNSLGERHQYPGFSQLPLDDFSSQYKVTLQTDAMQDISIYWCIYPSIILSICLSIYFAFFLRIIVSI